MKTLKLKLLALLAAVISSAAIASAQTVTPAYKASVIEITDMTNAKETIINTCVTSFTQTGIMSENSARAALTEWLDGSWDQIIDVYIQAYAKYFTQEDLDNIIAFYKTPTGKKMAIHSSDLAVDSQTAMFSKPEIMTSLQTILTKYAR